VPLVPSRHPLWDAPASTPTGDDGSGAADDAVRSLGLAGALEKTSPITSGRDTGPSEVLEVPEETAVPLALAFGLAAFFLGLLVDAPVVGIAGVSLAVIALLRWAWRTDVDRSEP
jgi:hypothetical protein